MAVIGVLAAILLPVFAQAREKARETSCLSNLHQLGSAVALYCTDYDEHVPFALDGYAKEHFAEFYPDAIVPIAAIMPDIVPTIQPYVQSRLVFRCPSEHPIPTHIDINYYQQYGSSYSYAVYPALLNWTLEDYAQPSQQLLLSDHDAWHGGSDYSDFRINVLFADLHTKNITWNDYLDAIRKTQ